MISVQIHKSTSALLDEKTKETVNNIITNNGTEYFNIEIFIMYIIDESSNGMRNYIST